MPEPTGEHHRAQRADALRQAAIFVVRRLQEDGHEAYLAGGCVRDRLMGHAPTDYDIATAARPNHIRSLFKNVHMVGESFGVALVRTHGFSIEVATFRTDGVYADGRRPESVEFSDATHDAQRRDFTINGLFEDPITEQIIDHVGGRADLNDRVIRAIGNPADRLAEDRLRTLRAVRFAARFSFAIDGETSEAIRRAASSLAGVSRERIGQEVRRMLEHPSRGVAAWELQYHELDTPVLGETHRTPAPMQLGRLGETVGYGCALAAWALDRHGPIHEMDIPTLARRWTTALMLSNADRDDLTGCLTTLADLHARWDALGVARQKRLASSVWFEPSMMLLRTLELQRYVDICRRVEELARTGLNPPALIDGDDLIRAGLEPGPRFGRVLDAVYDGQLEGVVTQREEALRLARFLAESSEVDPPEEDA